ncbi:MAG: ABC transporter ATP-binding protein [Chloroflexi bacterium]|nr:ABC transporter ATP-binding protein [Chloroflexota bacterium]
MVRAEGLGRSFGSLWAVRDVSFELRAGEVFGLLGPNGAGKTTTVRLLTALIAPSEGRAWVDGLDVVERADEVRARIGLLTETPALYERMTAVQNLDFFGRLHQVPAGLRAERIERLLRLFDLWDRRNTLTGQFSKGMKQKLAIARAMLHEPAVLFFDEPTAALDPEAAFIVRDALETLRTMGRTIVLSTHNLDEAARLCDRVAFIRGQVLRVDSPARLRQAAGGPTIEVDLAAEPGDTILGALRVRPGVWSVSATAGCLTVVVEDVRTETPGIVRALVHAGAEVLGVRETTATLESVYFEVMCGQPSSGAFAS